MNKLTIKKYIEVIKKAVDLIEVALEEGAESPSILEKSMPEKILAVPQIQLDEREEKIKSREEMLAREELAKHHIARKQHIEALMAIDCWPKAIPGYLIGNSSPKDQIKRANAVLDMTLTRSVEDIHFLDYGCGDGWIASEIIKRNVQSSTAFDVAETEHWDQEKVIYTTNPDDLKAGFYDMIFLYDVVDHATDAVGMMKHVEHLLKPNGICYVRCHPWTGRHASHLHKYGLNKAFIHLFLNWDELNELGYQMPLVRHETNPLIAYRWFFNPFIIEKERIIRTPLNEFFLIDSFKELVWCEQNIENDQRERFIKDMEIDFVDFQLVKKT
jgi:SAM-dependent methyltransferase